jgi:hypothetical protein
MFARKHLNIEYLCYDIRREDRPMPDIQLTRAELAIIAAIEAGHLERRKPGRYTIVLQSHLKRSYSDCNMFFPVTWAQYGGVWIGRTIIPTILIDDAEQ